MESICVSDVVYRSRTTTPTTLVPLHPTHPHVGAHRVIRGGTNSERDCRVVAWVAPDLIVVLVLTEHSTLARRGHVPISRLNGTAHEVLDLERTICLHRHHSHTLLRCGLRICSCLEATPLR